MTHNEAPLLNHSPQLFSNSICTKEKSKQSVFSSCKGEGEAKGEREILGDIRLKPNNTIKSLLNYIISIQQVPQKGNCHFPGEDARMSLIAPIPGTRREAGTGKRNERRAEPLVAGKGELFRLLVNKGEASSCRVQGQFHGVGSLQDQAGCMRGRSARWREWGTWKCERGRNTVARREGEAGVEGEGEQAKKRMQLAASAAAKICSGTGKPWLGGGLLGTRQSCLAPIAPEPVCRVRGSRRGRALLSGGLAPESLSVLPLLPPAPSLRLQPAAHACWPLP